MVCPLMVAARASTSWPAAPPWCTESSWCRCGAACRWPGQGQRLKAGLGSVHHALREVCDDDACAHACCLDAVHRLRCECAWPSSNIEQDDIAISPCNLRLQQCSTLSKLNWSGTFAREVTYEVAAPDQQLDHPILGCNTTRSGRIRPEASRPDRTHVHSQTSIY